MAPSPTRAPRRSQAARLFGYDLFISFALGPLPRGTQSYASDLARRLRERDFSVFFSEDEAPPGAPLTNTLRAALHRSQVLVVVANRGTLALRQGPCRGCPGARPPCDRGELRWRLVRRAGIR